MKHTPGPWQNKAVGIAKQDDHGLQLSFINTASDERRREASANARLIAAAPELLAALEWALPMAQVAIEDQRLLRIGCGHRDIKGVDPDGGVHVGLWQSEVDDLYKAKALLRRLQDEILR